MNNSIMRKVCFTLAGLMPGAKTLSVVKAKSPSSKRPLPLGWGKGLARHSELRHTFFLFSPTLRVPRFVGVLLSSILYSPGTTKISLPHPNVYCPNLRPAPMRLATCVPLTSGPA